MRGRYLGENPDIFGKEGVFRPREENDFWIGEDDDMPDGRFYPDDNAKQGFDCYVDEFQTDSWNEDKYLGDLGDLDDEEFLADWGLFDDDFED